MINLNRIILELFRLLVQNLISNPFMQFIPTLVTFSAFDQQQGVRYTIIVFYRKRSDFRLPTARHSQISCSFYIQSNKYFTMNKGGKSKKQREELINLLNQWNDVSFLNQKQLFLL